MPEQSTAEFPSLYGGFSTQPKHRRHKSQVADAKNVVFAVEHGFAKRNGTRFVAYVSPVRVQVTSRSGNFAAGASISTISGTGTIVSVSPGGNWINIDAITGTFSATQTISSTVLGVTTTATISQVQSNFVTGDSPQLFPIFRDTAERYLMVLGKASAPRIFSVYGGPEAEMTCASVALTYLSSNNAAASDMRAFSIADYTLIANTKVVIAGSNAGGTLTASTMPHYITRNGLSPLTFGANVVTWTSRASGNGTTNPLPTIWTRGTLTIADLCVHRERLWIGAGERMQSSQAGDYFNFWIEDATNLTDSDPIDIALPGQQIAYVDRLAPYRKSVLVFTKSSRQFELSSPDVMSPSTAAFTPSTAYDTVSTAPASMGNGFVFVAKDQQGAKLFSYEYSDLQVASTATPLSLHINGTLPNDISQVVSSGNIGFAACISPSAPSTVFVYFEHWTGNQRVQEAWAKWEFPGFSRITSIAVIEGVLYLLGETQTAGQFVIEGMVIGSSLSAETERVAPSGGSTSSNDVSNPLPDE